MSEDFDKDIELEENVEEEVEIKMEDNKSHMNFFQRIFGVIFNPENTMKDIVEKPTVLLPIIMMLSSFFVYIVNFSQMKAYMADITARELEKAGSNIEFTDSMLDFQTYFTLLMIPISILILWVICSALYFAGIKILRGKGTFKQTLSVVAFANVIAILSIIISAAVTYFTKKIYLETPLTGITNLIPNLKGTFIYGFCRGLDLFTIWQACITVIGLTIMSKLSKTKIISIVGIILIVPLIFAGIFNNI